MPIRNQDFETVRKALLVSESLDSGIDPATGYHRMLSGRETESLAALSHIEDDLEAKRRALVLAETNLGYSEERVRELEEALQDIVERGESTSSEFYNPYLARIAFSTLNTCGPGGYTVAAGTNPNPDDLP